jgi:hypothetical protein
MHIYERNETHNDETIVLKKSILGDKTEKRTKIIVSEKHSFKCRCGVIVEKLDDCNRWIRHECTFEDIKNVVKWQFGGSTHEITDPSGKNYQHN